MAGHSKFANIKHRKGAQDKKRAKLFTKLSRQIVVAVKQGGPIPENNPTLRAAIIAARGLNVSKDRIEAAIKKGSSNDAGGNYEEVRYEGYANGGIALIVEALTDNRNRTAGEIRSAFSKQGGNMGETGSVSFMFEKMGYLEFDSEVANDEEVLEAAIDVGATNCESNDYTHEIYCGSEDFARVRDELSKKYGEPKTARLSWQPNDRVAIDSVEKAEKLLKLIDVLEDNDDVQTVEGNFHIPDDIAEQLQD